MKFNSKQFNLYWVHSEPVKKSFKKGYGVIGK
jgi:hypothetical protein